MMRTLSDMAIRKPEETKYMQTKEMTQQARHHPEFLNTNKILFFKNYFYYFFINKILLCFSKFQ